MKDVRLHLGGPVRQNKHPLIDSHEILSLRAVVRDEDATRLS